MSHELRKQGTSSLMAITGAVVILSGIIRPASAQFFDFGFGRSPPRGGFGGGFFSPFQPQPQPRAVDYSRAPPHEKREIPAERNVLVLGDAMADWLAYGLENALSEQPDIGVIRKHKTISGLIHYQSKGEPADWIAAAKGILATEKPAAIVVMLGLHDRVPIRVPIEKTDPKNDTDKKGNKKDAHATTDGKSAENDNKAIVNPISSAKTDDKTSNLEQAPDDQIDGDVPPIVAPEKNARASNGIYDFRDAHWSELYTKKIEDMIAVLKAKGVPVIWVGLPAVRGQKATSDMLFLDTFYRDAARKAGITYVDVWDGFVDEGGRFMQQGPDFEGQTRSLRTADGVFFTKAGALKLAHYVEREIIRLLIDRSTPISLPSEAVIPDTNARSGGPAPRPLAGPIVPLVASSMGTHELLGGPGTRPAAVDALATRTLTKGEALSAPAGRADDFAWPRREVK